MAVYSQHTRNGTQCGGLPGEQAKTCSRQARNVSKEGAYLEVRGPLTNLEAADRYTLPVEPMTQTQPTDWAS